MSPVAARVRRRGLEHRASRSWPARRRKIASWRWALPVASHHRRHEGDVAVVVEGGRSLRDVDRVDVRVAEADRRGQVEDAGPRVERRAVAMTVICAPAVEEDARRVRQRAGSPWRLSGGVTRAANATSPCAFTVGLPRNCLSLPISSLIAPPMLATACALPGHACCGRRSARWSCLPPAPGRRPSRCPPRRSRRRSSGLRTRRHRARRRRGRRWRTWKRHGRGSQRQGRPARRARSQGTTDHDEGTYEQ